MSIKDTRRRKLAELEREVGGQSELISKTGLAQAYLSNLKTGHASFGEKAARKLEKLAGKPYLWLDDVSIKSVDLGEIDRQINVLLESVPEPLRSEYLQRLSDKK